MELTALAAAGVPASGPVSGGEVAARFKAALEPAAPVKDVYIDGASTARDGNPLVDVMKTFDSLDFKAPSAEYNGADRRYDDESSYGDEDPESAAFSEFGAEVLAIQAEILRTVLMMETMNTAKQGVTTLFQQQG